MTICLLQKKKKKKKRKNIFYNFNLLSFHIQRVPHVTNFYLWIKKRHEIESEIACTGWRKTKKRNSSKRKRQAHSLIVLIGMLLSFFLPVTHSATINNYFKWIHLSNAEFFLFFGQLEWNDVEWRRQREKINNKMYGGRIMTWIRALVPRRVLVAFILSLNDSFQALFSLFRTHSSAIHVLT